MGRNVLTIFVMLGLHERYPVVLLILYGVKDGMGTGKGNDFEDLFSYSVA